VSHPGSVSWGKRGCGAVKKAFLPGKKGRKQGAVRLGKGREAFGKVENRDPCESPERTLGKKE